MYEPQFSGIAIECYKEHKKEETLKRIKEIEQPLNSKGGINVGACPDYSEQQNNP